MSKVDLKVDWATYEAAKYACLNWHYSRCLPTGKLFKVGVWEDGEYVGVIVFSRGASPQIGKPYGLSMAEICELTRVATRKHKSTVTRMLSIGLRLLKKHSALRLVVSYADPEQCHHGGIYQAGNWVYTGHSTAKPRLILPDGTTRHNRLYQGRGGVKIPPGSFWSTPKPKHRYLMPLDKKMRKQILPLAKPYPKRSKQAMDGTTVTAKGQNLSDRYKQEKAS